MHRYLWLILVLAVAGCSPSGEEGLHTGAAALSVSVIESDTALGSAEYSVEQTAAGTFQISATNATDLKGVFLELRYDPALGHPVLVAAEAFGDAPISHVQETAPGSAQLGIVLPQYEERDGVNGNAVLGAVTFGKAPVKLQTEPRMASALSTVSAGYPRVDRATKRLTCALQLKGDYDQNGAVTISDLGPLAREFGKVGPFDFHSVESVVDGDENGAITISDISTIAAFYGRVVNQITLNGLDGLGAFQAATFDMSDVVGDGTQERRWLDVIFPEMKRGYYYQLTGLIVKASSTMDPFIAGPGIYGIDEPDYFTPEYYDDDFGLNYDANSGLAWSQYLRGDCNANRMVSISDLTALGVHMGESASSVGSVSWLCDSDANGLVGISDLTKMGLRLQITVDGVHAFHSTAAQGPPTDIYADFGQPLVGDPAPGDWVWVRATLGDFTGPACGIQQIP